MLFFLPYILLGILGVFFGFLKGMTHYSISWIHVLLILIVLTFSLLWGRNLYILYRTKNMKDVERLLKMYRRRPYQAFLFEMINGNYKQAEEQLSFIKNDQQKTLGLTAIYMQKKQFEQAKNENKKVKNNDVRNYNSALIALKEGDNEVFRQTKNNVKDEALQYILSTEEAYKNGDFNEAERLGKLAISKNAGIFRFILVKSLEREQKNPRRETFF